MTRWYTQLPTSYTIVPLCAKKCQDGTSICHFVAKKCTAFFYNIWKCFYGKKNSKEQKDTKKIIKINKVSYPAKIVSINDENSNTTKEVAVIDINDVQNKKLKFIPIPQILWTGGLINPITQKTKETEMETENKQKTVTIENIGSIGILGTTILNQAHLDIIESVFYNTFAIKILEIPDNISVPGLIFTQSEVMKTLGYGKNYHIFYKKAKEIKETIFKFYNLSDNYKQISANPMALIHSIETAESYLPIFPNKQKIKKTGNRR